MIGLQLFGDPEAADIVFTSGMNTLAIGIDLTTQVIFNGTLSSGPLWRRLLLLC